MAEKKLTGRIAADRIRMQSTPKPPAGAVERFLDLGECTSLISDVMDELGLAESAIGASVLRPTLPGKLVCGPALTTLALMFSVCGTPGLTVPTVHAPLRLS